MRILLIAWDIVVMSAMVYLVSVIIEGCAIFM